MKQWPGTEFPPCGRTDYCKITAHVRPALTKYKNRVVRVQYAHTVLMMKFVSCALYAVPLRMCKKWSILWACFTLYSVNLLLCRPVYCSVYHSIILSIYLSLVITVDLSFIYCSIHICLSIVCLLISVSLSVGLSVFIILSNVCEVLFLMECFSLPPHIRTHLCLCVCRFVRVCTEGPLSLSPLSLNTPGSRASTASASAVLSSSSSSRTRHYKSLSTSAHPCPADLHSHRPRQVPTPPKREPNRKPVMSTTEECRIKWWNLETVACLRGFLHS